MRISCRFPAPPGIRLKPDAFANQGPTIGFAGHEARVLSVEVEPDGGGALFELELPDDVLSTSPVIDLPDGTRWPGLLE